MQSPVFILAIRLHRQDSPVQETCIKNASLTFYLNSLFTYSKVLLKLETSIQISFWHQTEAKYDSEIEYTDTIRHLLNSVLYLGFPSSGGQ